MLVLSTIFLLILSGAVNGQNVTKIVIGQGATFVLRLPGTECGQYTLLNGLLRPVLVIEKNTPKLLGDYALRSEITNTDSGFNLKIKEASLQDNGMYKVASSKQDCKDIQYYVTVKAVQQAYLEQWGDWSSCTKACDSTETRSRTRNCSVNGGCQDLGPLEETQDCSLANNCAHWSEWSPFGECSAKCGKGFKIRSRNCLKSSSSLLSTGDCVGPSMQSHLCMTVCEIVGVWTGWTEWSGCFPECGDKITRNRTRLCNDPRKSPGCPGNYTEYEDCPTTKCKGHRNDTAYNTTTVDVISGTEVASASWLSNLNLVVFLVIAGAITLIILIVIFMLVRRRLKVKRINSARLKRDTQVENATIDKRLTQPAKRASRPDGVNVYSELGSSFCYNDSEFEDTEDEDGEDVKKDVKSDDKSVEEQENKSNNALASENSDAFTNTQVADSKDVVYDNNIPEATRNLSADSLYSDPPEEEDSADELKNDEVFHEPPVSDSGENKSVDTTENKVSGMNLFKEITGLFAVPTLKKKKSSKQEGNKTLDDMYKKVNKNRDKPNKVEINHERDVYYDPPDYNETADMDSFDDDSPEVDNVYENCDVNEGNTTIIPNKSETVNSERKVSDTLKCSDDDVDKTTEDKQQNTDNENDMHWKMKEALEESERALKTSEIIDNLLGDTKPGEEEHTYVNDEITKDMKNFYVLPRRKSNHIYDVPKSPR